MRYGTVVYGSMFLHQKAFVLGFFTSWVMFTLLMLAPRPRKLPDSHVFSMLFIDFHRCSSISMAPRSLFEARSSETRSWLLYCVPICAAVRLLMIPVIRAERVKFTRMADMAKKRSISLETTLGVVVERRKASK